LHHARIDVFDDNGRTSLHLAAANGHLELTKLLLQYKAFVNSKSKNGEAPLHSASQVTFKILREPIFLRFRTVMLML
jgi:ankyrin repeat protein